MKNLIVYYSLEGNTKFIARKIALHTDSKLLAINPLKDINSESNFKYIIGSFQALFKYKPPLQEFNLQDNKYDTLYIGTPVWSNCITPGIRSFLNFTSIKVNNYALFCTYKFNDGRALKQMENFLPSEKIIGKNKFKNVLENKDKINEKIQKWLNQLNNN